MEKYIREGGDFVREIKFRAWVKYYKHFHEGDITRDYILGEFLDDHDYEVSQYTGLKDKNGKEIYEGDVVKGYWWENGIKHRHIGKVTYGMSAYKVVGVKQYLGLSDELNPMYEVIGNIYENPEFLEGK